MDEEFAGMNAEFAGKDEDFEEKFQDLSADFLNFLEDNIERSFKELYFYLQMYRNLEGQALAEEFNRMADKLSNAGALDAMQECRCGC